MYIPPKMQFQMSLHSNCPSVEHAFLSVPKPKYKTSRPAFTATSFCMVSRALIFVWLWIDKSLKVTFRGKTKQLTSWISYHLRVRSYVERKHCCCQRTQELWTHPQGNEVWHIVIQISKELHQGDWIFSKPRAFFLWLPRLGWKTNSTLVQMALIEECSFQKGPAGRGAAGSNMQSNTLSNMQWNTWSWHVIKDGAKWDQPHGRALVQAEQVTEHVA